MAGFNVNTIDERLQSNGVISGTIIHDTDKFSLFTETISALGATLSFSTVQQISSFTLILTNGGAGTIT